jgi:hypothetical protein
MKEVESLWCKTAFHGKMQEFPDLGSHLLFPTLTKVLVPLLRSDHEIEYEIISLL